MHICATTAVPTTSIKNDNDEDDDDKQYGVYFTVTAMERERHRQPTVKHHLILSLIRK
jgi:hypothetical protein